MHAKICHDQARQVILEFLEPFAESGGMDAVIKAVAEQITPHAIVAARRALRQEVKGPKADVVLLEIRDFLVETMRVVEAVNLNPDMMAAGVESSRDLLNLEVKLRDWIYFLDHRDESPEVTVSPTADILLARGDAP